MIADRIALLTVSFPHLHFNVIQFRGCEAMDYLHDPVTWYGINYAGTQTTQWDFQNKGTLTSPARLSFVLEVPLRYLRPSISYSV